MTNSKIEQMIRKLVSRFFKQSDESIVMGDVIDAIAYEKQFARFDKKERLEIALEAISRLEGEEALEYARENIWDYYRDYFANPYTV